MVTTCFQCYYSELKKQRSEIKIPHKQESGLMQRKWKGNGQLLNKQHWKFSLDHTNEIFSKFHFLNVKRAMS